MTTATASKRTGAQSLKAAKPERVVLLVAGESGTGKSLWAASLKNALIFDTDIGGGLAYLDARIAKNGSERIQVGSYPEVMEEIARRRKSGALARYTTIAIDHLTALQQEAVLRHNPNGSEDFGKSYDKATREWRKIRELVRVGDFNLVCTAHLKSKYERQGGKSEIVGVTTDASKNIEADMMMVLYLQKRPDGGYPSVARVAKWRRDPEDARGPVPREFPFTMEGFLVLHGWPLDGEREEVEMATAEQVKELEALLEVVKLPEGTADSWLKKAKAESWDEMTAETLAKCISHLKDKAQAAAKSPPVPPAPPSDLDEAVLLLNKSLALRRLTYATAMQKYGWKACGWEEKNDPLWPLETLTLKQVRELTGYIQQGEEAAPQPTPKNDPAFDPRLFWDLAETKGRTPQMIADWWNKKHSTKIAADQLYQRLSPADRAVIVKELNDLPNA